MSPDVNPAGVHSAPLDGAASPDRREAVLSPAVEEAALRLYAPENASRFALSAQQFAGIIAEVLAKYASGADDAESLALVALLRVEELALARACAAGNAAAWDEFLNRYRAKLYEAALGIAHDEATARELADGLYANLYGLPSADGARVSRLNYYMGRGSLEGWLRTVLAQEYVNRYREQKRTVSLEEQIESGVAFAAAPTGIERWARRATGKGNSIGARHTRCRRKVSARRLLSRRANPGRDRRPTPGTRVHHQP